MYKTNSLNPYDLKSMKNLVSNIKGHHFNLGENKNDFKTTSGTTHQNFDLQTAHNARGCLNANLLDDLRNTHYKLGYMPDNNQSTHQATYVPMQLSKKHENDPQLRISHFSLNPTHKNVFDQKTIYMVDYPKKEPID